MNQQENSDQPPASESDKPAPPAYQPPMISGKLVISSMLAVGLSMAIFAWWARYSQSQQVLETWGRDAVVAIRTGKEVELLRATSEDSTEGESLSIGDSTVRFVTTGEISETPGLIHARHHLVHQKGFDWTGGVEGDCQPKWDTGLRFKDAKRNKVSTMLFDFRCNRVHLLENHAEVTMRPIIADALKKFFAEL